MACGVTRSIRKLTVTPLRCRDRGSLITPFGQIHSEEAENDVERLNRANGDKGYYYFGKRLVISLKAWR